MTNYFILLTDKMQQKKTVKSWKSKKNKKSVN